MAGGLGLGTWDKLPSEQHVEIDMDKKIIHPKYSSRYFSYDLCLLKVIKENCKFETSGLYQACCQDISMKTQGEKNLKLKSLKQKTQEFSQ